MSIRHWILGFSLVAQFGLSSPPQPRHAEYYLVQGSADGLHVGLYNAELNPPNELSDRILKQISGGKPVIGGELMFETLAALNISKSDTLFAKISSDEKTIALRVEDFKELTVAMNEAGDSHIGDFTLIIPYQPSGKSKLVGKVRGLAIIGKEPPFAVSAVEKSLEWQPQGEGVWTVQIESGAFKVQGTVVTPNGGTDAGYPEEMQLGLTYEDVKTKKVTEITSGYLLGHRSLEAVWVGPSLLDGSRLYFTTLPNEVLPTQTLIRIFPDGRIQEYEVATGSWDC